MSRRRLQGKDVLDEDLIDSSEATELRSEQIFGDGGWKRAHEDLPGHLDPTPASPRLSRRGDKGIMACHHVYEATLLTHTHTQRYIYIYTYIYVLHYASIQPTLTALGLRWHGKAALDWD